MALDPFNHLHDNNISRMRPKIVRKSILKENPFIVESAHAHIYRNGCAYANLDPLTTSPVALIS